MSKRTNRMMYLGWNTDKEYLMNEYNKVKDIDMEYAVFIRNKIYDMYKTWMPK